MLQRHHLNPIDPMILPGVQLLNATTIASFDIVDRLKQ
jgi:hypothetical protein